MYIDVWFDHITSSWVTQLKDSEGNQLENADYVHSKKEALFYANILKKDNQEATIRIYKRDGELQRQV